MSRWAKKERYRDPGFMGGLCAVCRRKPREYTHPNYPSMCESCRHSRLSPAIDIPVSKTLAEVATARSAGMDVMLRRNFSDKELAEAGRIAREKLKQLGIQTKGNVQNLNGKLDPRIQALFNKQEK